jgi:predicted  nucleic acid-binding Zn-ribbon protein
MTTKAKKRPQAAIDAPTETIEAPAPPERILTSDEREQALEAAHSEMERIEQECSSISASIDQALAEVQSIETRIDDRHKGLGQIAARVNAAQQAYEAQEQYVSIFSGRAGVSDLEHLQSELEKVESEHTRLSAEYSTLNDQDCATINHLRTMIADDRAAINRLKKSSDTIAAARRKLLQEHGEALFVECSTLLSGLEARNLECRDAMHLADSAMKDARSAIIRRLSPWPGIRRQLEAEHTISSDGSIEVLETYLQLLNVLVEHGPTVDILLLAELEFPKQSLQALASGQRAPIAGRRESIASRLEQYRKTFLAEQGAR